MLHISAESMSCCCCSLNPCTPPHCPLHKNQYSCCYWRYICTPCCYTRVTTFHILLLLWLYPCRVSYSLLLGLGNSIPGVRTPLAKQQNWAQVICCAYNTAHALAWWVINEITHWMILTNCFIPHLRNGVAVDMHWNIWIFWNWSFYEWTYCRQVMRWLGVGGNVVHRLLKMNF